MGESVDTNDMRRREYELLLRTTLSSDEALEMSIAALKDTLSLREVYHRYMEGTDGQSSNDSDRLRTVVDVSELAGENVTIIQSGFQELEDPWSLAQFAERKYSAFPSPEGAPLRRALFEKEPTAVVLGLLTRREFSFPIDLQDILEKVIRKAFINDQFDILTTPLYILDWASYAGENDHDEESEDDQKKRAHDSQDAESSQLLLKAKAAVATLRRLALVVEYPEDISVILNLGFHSAAGIAACALDRFTAQDPAGLQGSLLQIHNQATFIASRNEHLMAQMRAAPGGLLSAVDSLQMAVSGVGLAAQGDGWAGAAAEEHTEETEKAQWTPAIQEETKRTELQPLYAQVAAAADVLVDMDNVACEDCCSLLSPSAYFVDLLRLLKNCWIDPVKLAAGPSVLDRLLGRRPDLQHLQLSCANTKIEIPYIDVSNELMESVVEFLEENSIKSYGTYNCRDGDTATALAAEPVNVKWTLYDKYIAKLMTPMTTLPFLLHTEIVRHLLTAAGTSRHELLAVIHLPGLSEPPNETAHADYIDQIIAAEVLGLSQRDFQAITGEQLRVPGDKDAPRELSAAECWGYTSTEQAIFVERLALIQDQLLPRAGISFIDLVGILQIPWLKGALVIQNPQTPSDFTKLQKLRLFDPEGNPGPVSLFHKLGTFIRLFVRLGWSTDDLDRALAVCQAGYNGNITASMLIQLSAIKELARFCQWPACELLHFWQDYSDAELCRLLNVPAVRAPNLLRLVGKEQLSTPAKTLEIVRQWKELGNQGWSVDELLGLSMTVDEHLNDPRIAAFVSKLASNMLQQDTARQDPLKPARSQPAPSFLPQLFLIEQFKGIAGNVEPRILELLLETLSPRIENIRVEIYRYQSEQSSRSRDHTVPTAFLRLVGEIHQALLRGLQLVSHANLGPELLERLHKCPALRLNLSDWSLETVHRIMALASDYKSVESGTDQSSLGLMLWANESKADGKTEELFKKVAKFTDISIARAEMLLQLNYPKASKEQLVELLADPSGKEALRLKRQVAWILRYGFHDINLSLLFGMASPVDTCSAQAPIEEVLSSLAGRQSSLQVMHDQLRERRRDALIQYLLQHPLIIAQNVRDADGLFEYLLLDVQMGAAMRTNRMHQAIATVQLFVQRCLLGLERDIMPSVIPADRWGWMQQYRLWEANRKVFLYPENWVDPSLRDNKTSAFQDFEREMMQSELNEANVTDLVKKYIYQAHETAQLHIQSYHWDRQKSSYTIHLIGRTRTSPFTFFYRQLDGLVMGTKAIPTWSPWEKLKLDIPTYITDDNGQALSEAGAYVVPVMSNQQLHLFIAHVTSKARPMDNTSATSSIQGVECPKPGAKPQSYWEIKLGLTVQRGKQWSPVSISHASLNVDILEVDEGNMPSIKSFRFWTHKELIAQRVADEDRPGKTRRVESTRLSIQVDRWVQKGDRTMSVPAGSFHLRGQEILARPPSNTLSDYPVTLATVFGRFIPELGYPSDFKVKEWRTKWGVTLGQEVEAVALAEMPAPSQTKMPDTVLRAIEWTTSLDSYSRSTALVLDMAQEDAPTAQTWFAVPQSVSKDLALAPVAVRLDHVLSPALVEGATVFEDMASIYMKMRDRSVVPPSLAPVVFGSFEGGAYRESGTPGALYNWELGFHMISLLMERLTAVQKFDLALRVARQVFDPRMGREQQQNQVLGGCDTTVCWRFAPFADPEVREAGSLSAILRTAQASSGSEDAMAVPVLEWRRNPFNAHAVARNRPLVYMKRVAIKYIEILIAAGDHYFRQFTAESIPLAIQRYVEAAHIFGPAPAAIPKTVKPVVKSYSELSASIDDLSNAHIDLEILLPFHTPPHARASVPTAMADSQALVGLVPSSYFCVAINPEIVKLRSTIDDRLHKLRRSLDIDGQFRTPSSAGPIIDPLQAGRQMRARSGMSAGSPLQVDGPMPNYRFMNLLQRGLDLAQELKTTAATYLSIKERHDGEALAALNASHECTVQTLMLKIKESQLEEARAAMMQLQESRRSPLMRLEYFSKLTGDDFTAPSATQDFIPIEQTYLPLVQLGAKSGRIEISHLNVVDYTEIALAMLAGESNKAAAAAEATAGTWALAPGLSTQVAPWGVGINISAPSAGWWWSSTASSERSKSVISSEESQQASRVNRLHTQLQDRRLQANLAGLELQGIQKQIQTHQHRIEAVKQEIKLQEEQIQHASSAKDFLMGKWSNEQLYSWLDNSLRDHLYHTYVLALQMAQQAERALQFEIGHQASRKAIIPADGVWDSTHDGLLAGEGLYRALKHLEREYIHYRPKELEIVKNISLRQVDPLALLHLRQQGRASFSFPEELFDLDYPGHYHRRIQSVAVTIPCILGPYSSVNCTLTLKDHHYRVSSTVNAQGSDYASTGQDDSRFHHDEIPITAIAVSHGQNDAGVATLDFRGERYMPMEGAGAISSWTIALPSKYRSFDYSTISDVVLHIRYTARDGGQKLADAATVQLAKYFDAAAAVSAAAGLYTLLDLPNDFSNAWHSLKRPLGAARILPQSVPLQHLSNKIPFYARHNGATTIREILLFIGWEGSVVPGDSSRLQVSFHDRVLGAPGKEINLKPLPGLTCLHASKLSVAVSSNPTLTFDLRRTTTDPDTQKEIELTEGEEKLEMKQVGAMIERMARVFVLFRYTMASGGELGR
ncbi:hypothetical protein POX_d05669 [Penicillium oxalicum]|uniref:hypothetical protein n=1 Tax=Penicillium oxalicum TaxID=69781 RepID=UPI0020B6F768|nr:hypothetical protein POX_d05669 [Penicillium oxalicum]KAI2790163.1 hypothetical protein POX_d05669 [Penicillium oxalicum]